MVGFFHEGQYFRKMHISGEKLQSALTAPFSAPRFRSSLFILNCTILQKSWSKQIKLLVRDKLKTIWFLVQPEMKAEHISRGVHKRTVRFIDGGIRSECAKTIGREGEIMDLDIKQLGTVIKAIAEEKNLPEDSVKEVVEQALAAAYRKDFGDREQEVRVEINVNTGDLDVYASKEVVEKVGDDRFEISVSDANVIKKNAAIGDMIEFHQKADSFGRVAAQTAKQVILQRLREAVREVIMIEFEDKIGTVVNASVSRVEGRLVRLDLGKAQAIMPASEQIQGERYHPGQRLKVYLKDIERGMRGPQLIVSRGNTEFVEWLFRAEVPEMENNSVSIKVIAREAGVRSKIAVTSSVPGVDPVGTFVGGHGTRVNAVMSEIGEQEKIDIIVWDEDPKTFLINALSPTKVTKVTLDDASKKAVVQVPEDQLSIAIGKSGQNVRLASKLTGYEIDIVSDMVNETEAPKKAEVALHAPVPEVVSTAEVTTSTPLGGQKLKRKEQLESSLLEAIEEHGE